MVALMDEYAEISSCKRGSKMLALMKMVAKVGVEDVHLKNTTIFDLQAVCAKNLKNGAEFEKTFFCKVVDHDETVNACEQNFQIRLFCQIKRKKTHQNAIKNADFCEIW